MTEKRAETATKEKKFAATGTHTVMTKQLGDCACGMCVLSLTQSGGPGAFSAPTEFRTSADWSRCVC